MTDKENIVNSDERRTCGIIMPISKIDGCDEQHWIDVKQIISEAITQAGFEPKIVSDADDSSVIQKRIIQNLYENEIVVCDVSCKNSNVMFELGLRLAFDKPVVIIKDDVSGFSFDTSLIEHIPYPRSLSYYEIKSFQKTLSDKILNTVKESKRTGYSMFLKQFGEFKVSKISTKEVDVNEMIVSRIDDMSSQLSQLSLNLRRGSIVPVINHNRVDRIMRERIIDFCRIKNVFERMIWGNRELEDELFQFVERDEEIRQLCRNPVEVRKTMIDNLDPNR